MYKFINMMVYYIDNEMVLKFLEILVNIMYF